MRNTPAPIGKNVEDVARHDEMTKLRDELAGLAMQGFLANAYLAKKEPMNREDMSVASYRLADAMLKARAL